jgi:predicted nucleotidyltransferase
MPVRVGFSRYRKEMLQQELESIAQVLPMLGVEKVILTGDMVTEDYGPESQIELIVVHKTDLSFGRRADFFSYHLDTSVAVDTQVYTPEEFENLREVLPALNRACKEGRVIFDA